MGPMIASGAGYSAAAWVADLGFASHFAGHHQQRGIEQSAVGEIFDQGGEAAVKLRQQILLEAGKVVAVRVPASAAGALLRQLLLVLLPEHRYKRHACLDQPP